MDNSTLLTTLKDVGDWCPIPSLSSVAALTPEIWDIATTAQGNKAAIKSLADDTVETVYIVVAGLQHEGRKGIQHTPQIESDLQQLCGDLEKIKVCIEKHRGKRKWYNKLFGRHTCDEAFAGHWESLSQVLRKFGLKSGIKRSALVKKLLNEQKEFFGSRKEDWASQTKEAKAREVYGSMLPKDIEHGLFAPDPANGDTQVHIQGDHNVTMSSKKVTNINSGGSYTFTYTGK
ncbi:hypothetical protein AX16_009807 [Volvariella volvacea WC 439]|nr:hypothetical protein AX16_009807 [Volvariella volvacea WC 439]